MIYSAELELYYYYNKFKSLIIIVKKLIIYCKYSNDVCDKVYKIYSNY